MIDARSSANPEKIKNTVTREQARSTDFFLI